MPIRAVIIMFVVAVVFAVFYRDQIYKWVKENIGNSQKKEDHADKESDEQKEDQE